MKSLIIKYIVIASDSVNEVSKFRGNLHTLFGISNKGDHFVDKNLGSNITSSLLVMTILNSNFNLS